MKVILVIGKFKVTINKKRSIIDGKMKLIQEKFRITDLQSGETIELKSNTHVFDVIKLIIARDRHLNNLKTFNAMEA